MLRRNASFRPMKDLVMFDQSRNWHESCRVKAWRGGCSGIILVSDSRFAAFTCVYIDGVEHPYTSLEFFVFHSAFDLG